MKAIRVREFGGPEVMKLEEVPDLTAGPGQVVVSVKAVGVNPADTYMRSGAYAIKPALPYTPGMDGAGTVLAVGDRVEACSWEIAFTLAERCAAHMQSRRSARPRRFTPCPRGSAMRKERALTFPMLRPTAPFSSARREGPGRPSSCMAPAGAWASAAVQMARAGGLQVIGTAGTEKGLKAGARTGRAPRGGSPPRRAMTEEILGVNEGPRCRRYP